MIWDPASTHSSYVGNLCLKGSKLFPTNVVTVITTMNKIIIRGKWNINGKPQRHIDFGIEMNAFHIQQYKPTAVSDKMAASVFSTSLELSVFPQKPLWNCNYQILRKPTAQSTQTLFYLCFSLVLWGIMGIFWESEVAPVYVKLLTHP